MPLAKKPDITRLAGRRTLGAGLFAVIAGGTITSGIAAGMAASVTELMSVHLDADLIAVCECAQAADDRSSALMDLTDDMCPRDPRWLPAVDEARRIFTGCKKGIAGNAYQSVGARV